MSYGLNGNAINQRLQAQGLSQAITTAAGYSVDFWFWFNPAAPNNARIAFISDVPASAENGVMEFWGWPLEGIGFYTRGGTWNTVPAATGQIHHGAMVVTPGTKTFYVNRQKFTLSTTVANTATIDRLYIHNRHNDTEPIPTNVAGNHIVFNFRFYNTALTDTDVALLYTENRIPNALIPNTLVNYDFSKRPKFTGAGIMEFPDKGIANAPGRLINYTRPALGFANAAPYRPEPDNTTQWFHHTDTINPITDFTGYDN